METLNTNVMIVSDDALLVRSLQVALGHRGRVHTVKLMKEAVAFASEQPGVRAIVLDGGTVSCSLADVRSLRAAAPLVPALYVAAELNGSLLNDLQLERIQVVVRPLPLEALRVFLERALSAGHVRTSTLSAWIDHYAADRRLTPSDVALLPVVLEQEDSEAACKRLGIEEGELDERLRKLVKKCRVRNTDRLARNIMRDAYLSKSEATASFIEDCSADL